MEPDREIGARLAAARREAQLTQTALARLLGVTVRTIQNYEAGRNFPYRHLPHLQRLFERSGSWLLGGTDHGIRTAADSRAEARAQCARLRENLGRQAALFADTTRIAAEFDRLRSAGRDAVGVEDAVHVPQ